MATTLIYGGTVVSAIGRREADVLIDGESIAAILAPGHAAAYGITPDVVIDATGKYVVPGGVDAHVHMSLPFGGTVSADDFDTGSRAAAWGGVTTIIDFASQTVGLDVREALAERHVEAAGECHVDYAFHQIIGDVNEESLEAMTYLVENEGITSFKMFMAYPGVFYSDDGKILRAMQNASESGALMMMHAENGIAIDVLVAQSLARGDSDPKYHSYTRPEELESEATHRAIKLARVAGNVPLYIVHMSASEALEEVSRAQHMGLNVFAETCPQYLYLSIEDHLAQPGFEGAKWVCSTPLHPAHHYMIHLWDYRHPENAVQAAARCGVAGPSIAHMWHMPGHIYSRLKRYEDAVYQQEASARVDHAHMMRDRVMPDEINNFAHNNEWLIRNLSFVGRARDAMDLAVNMTQLPRHPKYNTLSKNGGSASYGRRRLLQILREYQLFDEAVELCQSNVLSVPSNASEQLKTLRLLGCSAAMADRPDLLAQAKRELGEFVKVAENEKADLEKQIGKLNASLDRGADAPPRPKDKKFDEKKAKLHLKQAKDKASKNKQKLDRLKKSQLAIEGYELVANEEYADGLKKLESATGEDVSWLGELQFLAGESEKGLEKIAE